LLLDQTYIIGESITLADVSTATAIMLVFQHVMAEDERKKYPALIRWFTTLVNQPDFKAIIGEFLWCKEALTIDIKRYNVLHSEERPRSRNRNSDSGKKQNKAKENKPKVAQEAKPAHEVKPKEKPAAASDHDDDVVEKKEKDPFLAFPVGSFNMDEWKRTYSNNDIASIALPYLFEKFDAQHYSVWFCNYKYNSELKMVFMSSNLIGGFYQRIEKMRKHAFGSMCIFGANNSNSISGLWIWRGQDLAFNLSEDLQIDYDCYEWKKLDFDNEVTRSEISQYFTQIFPEDKKFNQGKIYK